MSDVWMPTFKMKLTREEFDRLPLHPSYKYELIEAGRGFHRGRRMDMRFGWRNIGLT